MTTTTNAAATLSAPRSGRRQAIGALAPTLVRDVGAPTAAYYLLHATGASDWTALLAGALVSGAILVGEAVRTRKLDVFSGFMLGIFAVGLITSAVSGDARMMIVKDSFGTLLVGLAFAVSALGSKPLLYFAARRAQPDADAFEAKYRANSGMRTTMRLLSAMWGIGFLAESTARVVLAYQLPVSTMVWLSHVLMFGTVGVLTVITMRVVHRAQR